MNKCTHSHRCKHTFTWWMVASTLQRLVVVAFWGHFTVTMSYWLWHWCYVTRNLCLYKSGMKSPIKAKLQHSSIESESLTPNFSAYYETLRLPLFSLLISPFLSSTLFPSLFQCHLSSACVFPNSLPFSHKTWPKCESRWWNKHRALNCWALERETDKGRETEHIFEKTSL